MIHLPCKYQDVNPIPNSLERQLVYQKLSQAILTTNGNVFKKNHYGNEDVAQRLKAYSIGNATGTMPPNKEPKCYYCESYTEHIAVLQIEHFRPKAKVDNIDNGNLPHSGYYWLGIEWTNLLLSCPKCNGSNAKGNRFPITGIRATLHNPLTIVPNGLILTRNLCLSSAPPLTRENCVLINPEIEDPYTILTFNSDATLKGKSPNISRGLENINILNLNRDLLVRERDKKWQQIASEIKEASLGLSYCIIKPKAYVFLIDQIVKKIKKLKDVDQNYSLWGRYINENLDSLLEELNIRPKMKSFILHRYRSRI